MNPFVVFLSLRHYKTGVEHVRREHEERVDTEMRGMHRAMRENISYARAEYDERVEHVREAEHTRYVNEASILEHRLHGENQATEAALEARHTEELR